MPGFISHLDLNWEFPFYNWPPRLDGVARVILFDKRGTGLSDRSLGFGSLADRTDDLRTVIDAVGAERVAIQGVSEGGPMALLFAATYPDRVSPLIIAASLVCGSSAPDYPLTIRESVGRFGLDVRAGLHTGEVELRDDDITGLGVVIARRVCDLAGAGELLASRTVKDLVTGSGIAFEDRGSHSLKGVPDDWQLYAVAT